MVNKVIKNKVVNRLLGICECESTGEAPCNELNEDTNFRCSRNTGHKGRHFACGITHKIDEWD